MIARLVKGQNAWVRCLACRPWHTVRYLGRVLLLVSALVTIAHGETNDDAPPTGPYSYQGAFWGVQLHTGMVARGDAIGPVGGLSMRLASFMSLADLELGALASHYTVTQDPKEEIAITRVSAGLELHLHPFFLELLQEHWVRKLLASCYLSLGVNAEFVAYESPYVDGQEVDVGWSIGAGFDLPVTDPARGWALWLGFSYRYNLISVRTGISGLDNFDEHIALVTLGYRDNDIFFLNAPRPSEFDYLDPATDEP